MTTIAWVKCSKCGEELVIEEKLAGEDGLVLGLNVLPCQTCLDRAYDQGERDAYEYDWDEEDFDSDLDDDDEEYEDFDDDDFEEIEDDMP